MARRVDISTSGEGRKSGPNSDYPSFGGSQGSVDTTGIDQRESEADDFDYDRAIEQADESDNPDGYKYQIAVELAKNKAGEDVDDYEMRDLIDSEFSKLNPTASGAQMRGEDNIGAQVMGGFNEALNGLSDIIGSGIDTVWDSVVGTGAGIIGGIAGGATGNEDWGEAADDFVSGLVGDEDGAIFDTRTLGNMAMDIGLAAIPGVGVPLAMAKAGVQNSDNIRELIEGRDSISREKIDGDAQLAKLGATALDIGLSAAPGIGKLRNAAAADDILRSSGDDAMKALSDASQIGGGNLAKEISPSAMGRVASNAVKEGGARLSAIPDAVKGSSGLKQAAGNVVSTLRTPTSEQAARDTIEALIANVGRPYGKDIARTMASDGAEAAAKAADDAIIKSVVPETARSQSAGIRGALENIGGSVMSGAEKIRHPLSSGALKRGAGNLLGAGGNVIGSLGSAGVNYAAETNQGIPEGIGQSLEAIAEQTDPDTGRYGSSIISLLMPIGMNAIMRSNRMPGISGRMSSMNPALRYAQMAEGGDIGSQIGQRERGDYMDNQDIYDWLADLNGSDE